MKGIVLPLLLCGLASAQDPEEAKIQEKVREALPVLVFAPNPEEPELKTASPTLFPAHKGMDAVYAAINALLAKLQPHTFPSHLLPAEPLDSSVDDYVQSFRKNYVQWLEYEEGFVILGGVSLGIALVFTIAYLLYLCCRCCCAKKKSGKPLVDKRLDGCQRVVFTGFLSIITVVGIFAVVLAFLGNQYTHSSAQQLPTFAKAALDDLRAYRDSSNLAVRKLLIQDFGALNRTLLEGVRGASGALVTGVKAWSGASALDALAKLSTQADTVQGELEGLEAGLGEVETRARELQRQLRRLFTALKDDLDQCVVRASEESELCRTAQGIFDTATQLPLDVLTDVSLFSEMREKLGLVKSYNIAGKLDDARCQFLALEQQFRDEMARREVELHSQLGKYASNLTAYADLATQHLAKLKLSDAYIAVENHSSTFKEYELYRWLGQLGCLVLLALSISAFGLGLFYGCCGKRPSYFEDDCCVRSSGSKLFACGIGTGLLLLLPLMLIAVVLMFAGGNTESLLCDPLKRPQARRDVFKVLEKLSERVKTSAGRDLDPWLRDLTLEHIFE